MQILRNNLTLLKWGAAGSGMFASVIIALNIPVSGWAFVIFLVSSLLWVIAAIIMKERAIMTESSFYVAINLVGIYRWLF